MLLERTIAQLDAGPMPPAEAEQLGQLGYMQWIAGLGANADYLAAARHAYAKAAPYMELSPAVVTFCRLLQASIDNPLTPMPLLMPPKCRRGGAQARRSARVRLR